MPKWYLYSHCTFENTNDPEKCILYATTIMSDSTKKYGDSVRPSEAPRIITSADLKLNYHPMRSIIKMTKKKYLDDFFCDGTLQLGSFGYFMSHENHEVRDTTESITVIVGRGKGVTTVTKIGAGYDYRVFCCFLGDLNRDVVDAFGYDAAFEITDPDQFSCAIGKCLSSPDAVYGQCAYTDKKVISVPLPDGFNWKIIGNNLTFPGDTFRYFLKPKSYEHQNEFRFLWKVDSDISDSTIIKCPEAVKFCRRIDLT